MLTEMECRQAKPREKVYSLSDGNGLFLEIRPSGAKYWIGRLWDGVQKKEIRRSFGRYPQVLAREARDKNIDFRRQDFIEEEKSSVFEKVAEEWFEKKVVGIRAPSIESPSTKTAKGCLSASTEIIPTILAGRSIVFSALA